MDVEHLISDAAMIYLYWQQNRILALQGPPMQPSNWRERLGKLHRYWSMLAMAALAVAVWIPRFLPAPRQSGDSRDMSMSDEQKFIAALAQSKSPEPNSIDRGRIKQYYPPRLYKRRSHLDC